MGEIELPEYHRRYPYHRSWELRLSQSFMRAKSIWEESPSSWTLAVFHNARLLESCSGL